MIFGTPVLDKRPRAATAVTVAPGTSCKDLIQSDAMADALMIPQRSLKLMSSAFVFPRRMSLGVFIGRPL